MILERVTPESVGIHSEGILKFIDLAESRGLELHSMMLPVSYTHLTLPTNSRV